MIVLGILFLSINVSDITLTMIVLVVLL
jgi:hypothetical protein